MSMLSNSNFINMFLFFCFSCTRSMIIRNARNFSMNYFHSCKREVSAHKKSHSLLCKQTQPILHLISPGNSIVLLFWLRAMRQRPLSSRAVFEIGRNHFQQSLKETNNFKYSIIQQKYLHIDAESF